MEKFGTTTMRKIQTIDVIAKEWRDKINGNSYFAGKVIVNYGLRSEKTFVMPFQYGYGEQYLQEASAVLEKAGYPVIPFYGYTTRTCRESGIILRHSIQRNCLKRELKQYEKH